MAHIFGMINNLATSFQQFREASADNTRMLVERVNSITNSRPAVQEHRDSRLFDPSQCGITSERSKHEMVVYKRLNELNKSIVGLCQDQDTELKRAGFDIALKMSDILEKRAVMLLVADKTSWEVAEEMKLIDDSDPILSKYTASIREAEKSVLKRKQLSDKGARVQRYNPMASTTPSRNPTSGGRPLYNSKASKYSGTQCWMCNQFGHIASYCPKGNNNTGKSPSPIPRP